VKNQKNNGKWQYKKLKQERKGGSFTVNIWKSKGRQVQSQLSHKTKKANLPTFPTQTSVHAQIPHILLSQTQLTLSLSDTHNNVTFITATTTISFTILLHSPPPLLQRRRRRHQHHHQNSLSTYLSPTYTLTQIFSNSNHTLP